MRRFSLKILIFVSLLFVADWGFGMIMDKVLVGTTKGDWGRSNYLMNEAVGDVVVLGSSRAIHHYDTGLLSDTLGLKCINAGEDGMGVLLMKSRLLRIIDRQSPRLVIYEILPEFDLYKEKDNAKYLKFLRPYVKEEGVLESILDIDSVERWKLMSRMYQYNSVFIDIISQRVSKAPGSAKDFRWAPLKGEFDGRLDSVSGDEDKEVDPLKEEYLIDIVQICRDKGILLLFVASPYYGAGAFEMPQSLSALCKEYSIPFIDHFNDPSFISDPSLFVDSSHLNQRGASQFTELIGTEVREYLMSIDEHL